MTSRRVRIRRLGFLLVVVIEPRPAATAPVRPSRREPDTTGARRADYTLTA
jgi:hypothetical protein